MNTSEKEYIFGLRLYNESLSGGCPKSGHIGFYLEDPSGRQQHFDHGMVGSGISKGNLSKTFEKACMAIPFVAMAAYSAMGLHLAETASSSPLMALAGIWLGSVYGGFLGLGIGVTVKDNPPVMPVSREIRIEISKKQFDRVLEYADKYKFSAYSAGIKNCITYTEALMRHCGIKTAGQLSGTLTLPSRFARNIELVYTPTSL